MKHLPLPPSVERCPALLRPYSYKMITYRYWGRDYHLLSSQQLFSATQIDRGSQLLLKSLLPDYRLGDSVLQLLLRQALASAESRLDIWDWGCGIGPLGLMVQGHLAQLLQKHNKQRQSQVPQHLDSALRVFDCDALALAFTQVNWQYNIQSKLCSSASGSTVFSPSLQLSPDLWGEEGYTQVGVMPQLVLSNIPAKLGEPVLRRMLPALAISTKSYVAIVIVARLRHLLEEAAALGQIEILHLAGSGDHCVVHYRQHVLEDKLGPKAGFRIGPIVKLYKRGESCFSLEHKGNALQLRKSPRPPKQGSPLSRKISRSKWLLCWPFDSAYGLPDFDQPSYGLELMLTLLARYNWGGRVLLWEAGHGHLACFLALKPGCHVEHIDFAGRNRLGLLFGQYNVENLQCWGVEVPSLSIHSLPCLEAMPLPATWQDTTDGEACAVKGPAKCWSLVVLPLQDKYPKLAALLGWLDQLATDTWLCLQGPSHLVKQFQSLRAWSLAHTKAQIKGHGLLAQLWRKS